MGGGRQEEGGGGAGERRGLTPRILTGRKPVILLQSLSVLSHYSLFRMGPFKLLSHYPPCEEENGVPKSWSNMRRSSKRLNTVVSLFHSGNLQKNLYIIYVITVVWKHCGSTIMLFF